MSKQTKSLLDLREQGEEMCRDLRFKGYDAEWFLHSGELLLYLDQKWIMKCIGKRDFDGELRGYWVAVRPTFQSIMNRQITGSRKIHYAPIYKHDLLD